MVQRRPAGGSKGRAAVRDDRGFTLVELLMAMSVFSILIVGFSLLFASSLKSFGSSRARTVAGQLASTELERARNVGWDNLGTIAGNPPGTLVAGPETVTVGTVSFSVTRRVELIDDPVPSGFTTGANYKRVIIRVSSPLMTTPLQTETIVAPPIQPSLYTAVLKVDVVTYNNTVLPGALVALTGGPSADRGDTTNADGRVTFAGLTPHPNVTDVYTLTPTLAGFKRDFSVLTTGKVNLAPGDVTPVTLKMYKPGTITFTLRDLGNDPVDTPAEITISGKDDDDVTVTETISFTSPTGVITVSSIGGKDLIPGNAYTITARSIGYELAAPRVETLAPANYPTNVDTPLTLQLPIPARVATTLRFVDKPSGLPMAVAGTLVGTPTAGGDDPGAFTTDATGIVGFDLLPRTSPNGYRVTVTPTPPGYYPFTAVITATGTVDPLDLTFELVPLPPPTPVTFAVRGGTPTAPLPGIPVTVSGGPSGTVVFTSDSLGQGIVDLVDGSYTITVTAPGYVTYTAPLTVVTGMTPVDVVLGSQGAVTLEARNATTSAAVGPVELTLVGGTGSTPVTIPASGSTFLYLNPGTYAVTSSSVPAGYGPYSGTVTVVSGPQTVPIALSDQGTVTFRTTRASDATTLAGVTVLLSGPAGATGTVTTDASGLSSAQTLVPGTWTYTTSVSGFAPNKGTFTVAGGVQTVQVPVTQGVNVTIRTRDDDDTSRRVGPVQLRVKDGPGADQIFSTSTGGGTTGPGGQFATMMLPGTYTVEGISYPAGYSSVVTTSITVSGSGGNITVRVT